MKLLNKKAEVSLNNQEVIVSEFIGGTGRDGSSESEENIKVQVLKTGEGYKKIFLPKTNVDNLDKNVLKAYNGIEIKKFKKCWILQSSYSFRMTQTISNQKSS